MASSIRWTPPGVIILTLWIAGLVPAFRSFWLGADNELGPDPVRSFEHLLGLWAFRFLLASLAITPLRLVTGYSLIRYRRTLGLLAFVYALMHVATYIALDLQFDFAILWRDLTRRPFLVFGMIAFLCLIPLAATSSQFLIRKLGRNWRRLHRIVYVALVAASAHFLMAFKTWHPEALLYVLSGSILLIIRVGYKIRSQVRQTGAKM
ncbi:protein-methionine-sulfoxide reductase heme-binding subunit MsrQ [Acetobacter musti]|uniref:Protein-methionine-sulfoxide reductase heme-binding subunit MsrQ n=1 Tax=Acetobacter musti TaxID=864732 RepID=A0ABX0JTM8_9PROT|nr:protein-methionine-sulfoxide reductase heme-binding subunit MsrQ [Acetobacter musti]NHN86157.1 protein-methionine-sulfoxide reductase heme-binding subunit MsrQ [Acetobacter musti]